MHTTVDIAYLLTCTAAVRDVRQRKSLLVDFSFHTKYNFLNYAVAVIGIL